MKDFNWIAISLAVALLILLIYNIFRQIKECHLQNDPMLHQLKRDIEPLFKSNKEYAGYLAQINNNNILETISLFKGDKSYTINKEKIYLCLNDENGKYYDKNLLLYVLLHELSHVMCDEVGHTDEFYNIFDELLKEAINQKIYDSTKPVDPNYCKYND